jgi:glycosyltransferase involved in cell wall biosynthesis
MFDNAQGSSEPLTESGVTVCIPVFNDWESVTRLLEQLNDVAPLLDPEVRVVLVDDGSDEPPPERLSVSLPAIARVDVLQLRRNVGHQRAIALGLAFVNRNCPSRLVVVMDGDGEDAPADIPKLLDACRATGFGKIVFARRRKRTEGLVFRLGYFAYRIVHYVLTGRGVSIGNFSVIPSTALAKVVGVSELWNHYAAGVIHARLPVTTVPIDRGHRIAGRSKMNFVSLVSHGMSAISVYGDVVGVRLLCLVSILLLLAVAGLVAVVAIRLGTTLAIPGWATNAFGLLNVVMLNLLMLTAVFVLFVLRSRNMADFLPVRDWKHYVIGQVNIHQR